MENKSTVERRLATTMVSTKDKPLLLWLSLCAVLFLSMAGEILSQPQGSLDSKKQAKAVTANFHLQPDETTVWRRTVEGDVHLIGAANEQLTLGLNPSEANGSRKIIVEFRVPLWFGEYISAPEFLDVDQLKIHRRFPSAGEREMSLSAWQRFQVTTLRHPIVTVVFGIALVVLPFWIVRRRQRTVLLPDEKSDFQVPGYEIGAMIGEGAMGAVYSARGRDGATYALKVLRGMLSESEKFKKQFDKELRIYQTLDHPNLLQLFGFGYTSDGRTFMATELLSGESLKDVIVSKGLTSGALAAEVLEQIGSALDYLHGQNIVHQDVKPGNIFVGEDGVIKLLDLGISKASEEAGGGAGTPAYMAPEQFQKQATIHSDQYSLGLVLKEMVVGRGVELSEKLDPVFQAAFEKMLAEKPEDRYADLQEARDALMELLLLMDAKR